jgi:DNA-binding transcriptional LysR family regulator
VLKRFAKTHPSVAVDVIIDQSSNLRRRFNAGQLDITLMTCFPDNPQGNEEIVLTEPIVWAGAKGGCAHLRDPIPLSIWEEGCAWRAGAIAALEKVGRAYRVAYMSAHTSGQRAAILADLAVAPLPKSFVGNDIQILGEIDGLPEPGTYSLSMLVASDAKPPVQAAADHFRATFVQMQDQAAVRERAA